MPPRKSNVSLASANGEAGPGPAGTPSGKEKKDKDKDEIAIEDLTMPRTMIQRLAKGVLPEGTQLQRDAVTALCKSATVFVSHIAGAASEECSMANRRTVNPSDVFAALRETEHAGMIPRLEKELAKYIDVSTSKRNEYRRKMKEKADGDGTKEDGEGEDQTEPQLEGAGGDEPRSAKRAKGADGAVARAPGEEGDEDTMEVDDDEGEEGQDEEEEEEEDDDDDDEDDDEGGEDDEPELDPAAAQLERESRAVNEQESGEDSD